MTTPEKSSREEHIPLANEGSGTDPLDVFNPWTEEELRRAGINTDRPVEGARIAPYWLGESEDSAEDSR